MKRSSLVVCVQLTVLFWPLILLNIVHWFYFGSSLVLLWQLTVLLGAKSFQFIVRSIPLEQTTATFRPRSLQSCLMELTTVDFPAPAWPVVRRLCPPLAKRRISACSSVRVLLMISSHDETSHPVTIDDFAAFTSINWNPTNEDKLELNSEERTGV